MFLKYMSMLLLAGSAFGKTLDSGCCYSPLKASAPDCDGAEEPAPNVDVCECPLGLKLVVTSCNPKRTDRVVLYETAEFAKAITFLYLCGGTERCPNSDEPPKATVLVIDRNTFLPEPTEDMPFLHSGWPLPKGGLVPVYETFDVVKRSFEMQFRGSQVNWDNAISLMYEERVYLSLNECEKYQNIWEPQLRNSCEDDFEGRQYGPGCVCQMARRWWDQGFFECPDPKKRAAVACPPKETPCGSVCHTCLKDLGCKAVADVPV